MYQALQPQRDFQSLNNPTPFQPVVFQFRVPLVSESLPESSLNTSAQGGRPRYGVTSSWAGSDHPAATSPDAVYENATSTGVTGQLKRSYNK